DSQTGSAVLACPLDAREAPRRISAKAASHFWLAECVAFQDKAAQARASQPSSTARPMEVDAAVCQLTVLNRADRGKSRASTPTKPRFSNMATAPKVSMRGAI